MAREQKSKNNVIRLLESRDVQYVLYTLPSEKISALDAANLINISPDTMYKTIVLIRESKSRGILAVVPATKSVNPKKVAAALAEKKVHAATLREAELLTHLKTGGISPLALLKSGFPVLLDDSALIISDMHLSGGERGMIIRISVRDFISLTGAIVRDISDHLPDTH